MGASRVYVCNRGLKRIETDPHLQNNKEGCLAEVRMVVMAIAYQQDRPHRSIGPFKVSPRDCSNSGIRLAWRHEGGNLYIDDFLYHKRVGVYVDDWGKKAANGSITPQDYINAGYVPIQQFGEFMSQKESV